MLETARTADAASVPQECSSIGRAPVSKTGGRRFEPCHSCQRFQALDRKDAAGSVAATKLAIPAASDALVAHDAVLDGTPRGGRRPDQRAEPTEDGPAEEQIEQEDRQRVVMAAQH